MSEKHKTYPIVNSSAATRTGEIMYSIFQFISSSGQNAIRFAYGSTGAAVSSSIGYGGSPTAANFVSGSFIVLEPAAALPSGYRWQTKIEYGPVNAVSSTLSTVGGWEGGATKNFIAASTNNPPGITPPVTDAIPWVTAAPTQGDLLLISSCDLDTYGTGTSVPYFRVMQKTGYSGATFAAGSMYVGGYIPLEKQNTNPVCLLARLPSPLYNNGYYWGTSTNSTTNLTRVAPDYTFTATSLTASYAGLGSVTFYGNLTSVGSSPMAKDLDGGWVNLPVYVGHVNNAITLGYFGKYNMLSGYNGRAIGTCDSSEEYMNVYGFYMRWKPSA